LRNYIAIGTTYIMSKMSRAYNLTYWVFGYTFASLVVTGFYELSIQDRVLISVPIGSFIGAFLFYMKPELSLIRIVLRASSKRSASYLESPYLIETKGYIIGALYFTLAIFLSVFTLSLPLILRVVLVIAGGFTSVKFLRETKGYGNKAEVVLRYHFLISHKSDAGLPEKFDETLSSIRNALEKADWVEANQLIEQLEKKLGTKIWG